MKKVCNYIIILTLLSAFTTSILTNHLYAQKQNIEIKNDMIFADKIPYAKMEKEKCLLGVCNYKISDMTDKAVLYIKYEYYDNPSKVTASNPNGRVSYFTWNFLTSQSKCETEIRTSMRKIAEMIVKNELIKDGTENATAIQNFVMVNGSPYSRDREDAGKKIIIIQK